jgi:diaminohydroxyphosphoribosylaminopyrimidine deaminase/5-amino-6-(5-phosphoribosylamino)uracil reductase
MRRALALARSGLGATSPNPCVGAVALDADLLEVGEGRSEPPGGAHAEVVALRHARGQADTLVCTLEPCDATGRTGPCTQALIDAGVRRVVYAVDDPMPGFGGGAATLRAHGIEVVRLMTAEATEVHRPWLVATTRGTPYVTLKLAGTLDGRAAAQDGTSRWITGEDARADAHRIRGEVDAIIVGSGTVIADDPALTARGTAEPREPLRVVLDRRGRVPATARVHPAEVYVDDLPQVLKSLQHKGIRHVLVEGGPAVAGAFAAQGLVDEVVAYVAPVILGAGLASVVTDAVTTIADARRFETVDVRQLGADVRITVRPIEEV